LQVFRLPNAAPPRRGYEYAEDAHFELIPAE